MSALFVFNGTGGCIPLTNLNLSSYANTNVTFANFTYANVAYTLANITAFNTTALNITSPFVNATTYQGGSGVALPPVVESLLPLPPCPSLGNLTAPVDVISSSAHPLSSTASPANSTVLVASTRPPPVSSSAVPVSSSVVIPASSTVHPVNSTVLVDSSTIRALDNLHHDSNLTSPTLTTTAPLSNSTTHTSNGTKLASVIAPEPEDSYHCATFIFLADPQQWRSDSGDTRRTGCSDLNVALNTLDTQSYPTNFGIAAAGKPIGPVDAVFFGGDMCQTGGDYSFIDQYRFKPPTYRGGSELVKLRSLYQTGFSNDQGVTRLKYDPKYFGLGNHDVQSDYVPAIGWYKGRWPYDYSLKQNFWRYQMWNFITQMHTGYDQRLLPKSNAVYPIDWQNIDSEKGKGTFDYEEYSLNYVIDLGPADVFQLHRFGGDSDHGRKDGISWLQGKLAERGTIRPIIIVQHYLFSETVETGGVTPSWTNAQRDRLLNILAPYNIIGFFVGHNHGTGFFPKYIPVPTGSTTRSVPEFRPGAAFNRNAALVRVTPSTMDVLYGTASGQSLTWTQGGTFPLPSANQIWQMTGDWNNDYFGKLGSIYVDTRRVRASQGKVIVSCGLARSVSPDPTNRITWSLVVANADGTEAQTVGPTGDASASYFPGQGGMKQLYGDLAPVVRPAGTVVVGVFFWQKTNRVAPGLVVRSTVTGDEWEVTNSDQGDSMPGGSDGSKNIYADSNMVPRPTTPGALQMGGVALYQKGGNRMALKVLYL